IGGSPFQPLSADELTTTASCKGHKNTASQDQTRQSRTDDGAGDTHAVEHEGRVKLGCRGATNDVGADPQPVGCNTSLTVISCPALKISEAGGKRRSGRHQNRLRGREP